MINNTSGPTWIAKTYLQSTTNYKEDKGMCFQLSLF